VSILGRAKEWAERRLVEAAVIYVLRRMADNLKGDPMIALLQGKKTYITGLAMIAWGLWTYFVEQNVVDGTRIVLEGVGLMTLRAGVTKSGPATN
jgi:hypothetical protein